MLTSYINQCTIEVVKRRDLESRLRRFGWWFLRHGSNHDIWTNGEVKIPVPRHAEINEMTARSIIKKASNFPPEKGAK